MYIYINFVDNKDKIWLKKRKKKRFVCMFMSLCLGMYEGNDLLVILLIFIVFEGELWLV